MRRELLSVTGSEEIGPYRLLRVRRGGRGPGIPGQFFMLTPPGRLLPRPMSLCMARAGELAFLVDPIGPGTRALASAERGERVAVLGPLGTGYRLDVRRPLLVGGGVGVAPLPYLSERLGRPPALLGFRSAWHAEAAALVPNADLVVEPTLVTDALRPGRDVLACGPEPMLRAVARLAPGAQLAWEAPMACGYGACYGCAVAIGGKIKRLCIDGPVLDARDLGLVGRRWQGRQASGARTVRGSTGERRERGIPPRAAPGTSAAGLRPAEAGADQEGEAA